MKIIKIIILLSIMSTPLSFAHEIQLSPLVSHIQYLPPLINFLRVQNEQSKGKHSRYFWLVSHYNSEHIQTKECVWHTFGEQAEIWVEKNPDTWPISSVTARILFRLSDELEKQRIYSVFTSFFLENLRQRKKILEIITILMKRFQSFHKKIFIIWIS